MFGLFKSKNPKSPIDEEMRLWMENAILWLASEFSAIPIDQRKVFTPTPEDISILFDGTVDSGYLALQLVGDAMEVDLNNIELHFFESGVSEFDMGGSVIFTEQHKGSKNAAGLYFHKDVSGKNTIALDRKLLREPEKLIATIAHELSHYKLLAEERIDFNDECLTDLTTVIFGFGIFNANGAFEFSQSSDRWGYSKLGYLTQMEWGYALALFAFLRGEDKPLWLKHLNRTIRSDFKKSMEYILANRDKIFTEQVNDEK